MTAANIMIKKVIPPTIPPAIEPPNSFSFLKADYIKINKMLTSCRSRQCQTSTINNIYFTFCRDSYKIC